MLTISARRWIAILMIARIASARRRCSLPPNSLYVPRMLVGIAEAGFLPGLPYYMTYWFPAHYRARANALFMIAMPVTMALGSLASGYILNMDGMLNLKGDGVAVPAGRLPVGAVGSGGLVLAGR